MRDRVEIARDHFQNKRWQLYQVQLLLERGKITQEEYDYIIAPAQ